MKTKVGSAVLFFCIGSALLSISVSSSLQERALYRRRIQVCGSHLTDALSVVCNGSYYNPQSSSQDKRFTFPRNDLLNRYWNIMAKSYGYPIQNISPFLSNRRKRGVVDDCCKNSCTVQELGSYCSSSPSIQKVGERDIWME